MFSENPAPDHILIHKYSDLFDLGTGWFHPHFPWSTADTWAICVGPRVSEWPGVQSTSVRIIPTDSLQWRLNEPDGASNHRHLDCLLNYVLRRRSERRYQSFMPLASVRGVHRWPVDSPPKGPATRKMFPFGDVVVHLMSPNSIRNIYRCGLAHTYIKYISPHILIHIYVHTRCAPHDAGETVSWKTHIYTHQKQKQKKKKKTHVVTGGTIGCLDDNPRSRLRRQKSSNRRPPAPLRVCFPTAARGDISIYIYIHIYILIYPFPPITVAFLPVTHRVVSGTLIMFVGFSMGAREGWKLAFARRRSHRPLLLCIYPTACGACRGRLTPTLAH